jgi:hypothetical protein
MWLGRPLRVRQTQTDPGNAHCCIIHNYSQHFLCRNLSVCSPTTFHDATAYNAIYVDCSDFHGFACRPHAMERPPQILPDTVAGAKASRQPRSASIVTGLRRRLTQKLFRFGHFGIPFL